MIAAVTGATGLLGSNLVIELLRQAHQVRALYRSLDRTRHLRTYPVEWVRAELCDGGSLRQAFRGVDVVFHCAAAMARKDTAEMIASNVDAVRHVLGAVRSCEVGRLIHCSTVSAIGSSKDNEACSEDMQWDEGLPVSLYTRTKREAELLIQEAASNDVNATIVNPAHMLGAYGTRRGSSAIVLQVARGILPRGLYRNTNFVDVRDVARGMILACRTGRRGQRYILGGENLTYRDAIDRIARIVNVPSPARTASSESQLMQISSTDIDFIYTSDKAKRELGYKPASIDGAIGDTLAWFRSQGLSAGFDRHDSGR